MIEKVEIGTATLYHGDSIEILPSLSLDAAIVSDPPYGMDWDTDHTRFTVGPNGNGHGRPSHQKNEKVMHDNEPFDPSPWLGFARVVLFGFQHYAARLPVGTVLIWLKRNDDGFGSFLSDADLAWMKGGHGVYCKRDMSLYADTMNRLHPTQKPVNLMAWCIEKAKVPQGGTVIDPYMGSGTTGEACIKTGHTFIGIDKERKHFETACKRIEQAQRQMCLYN